MLLLLRQQDEFKMTLQLQAVIKANANGVGMRLSTASVTYNGQLLGVFPKPAGGGSSPAAPAWVLGVNLSGMEWAQPGLRFGASNLPNINYTVPRKKDVSYLAALGFTKFRLPIQWELLQPTLSHRAPNTAVAAAIGSSGSFRTVYQDQITYVLDACRTASVTAIIDLHNYCRYQDFVYSSDGSVASFVAPTPPIFPYTTDNTQVKSKIFATTAATASAISIANFTDFWSRAATLWKNHAGLGGYGLMNEPHDMPATGTTSAWNDPFLGPSQDGSIWIQFAQAAITAIRSIDTTTKIYVGGNNFQFVCDLPKGSADVNPSLASISGAALVFDGHMYLDASSSGASFDWATEVAKGNSAGEPAGPITTATGANRLSVGTAWANTHSFSLALTELGMPVDDSRWYDSFKNAIALAHTNNVEIYAWMGGNHWPIHSYPINCVPQWHQHKTMEPLVSGFMRNQASIYSGKLFDSCQSGLLATSATATVTVYARGSLQNNITVSVAAAGTGTLSKTQLVISAGANNTDSFTYIAGSNEAATITYTYANNGDAIPPRLIYSIADPTGLAATNLSAAAMAIMQKYNACLWNASDAHTDYMNGAACTSGTGVRAIADSGWGSAVQNPQEMIQWVNLEATSMGAMVLPTWETAGGLARVNFDKGLGSDPWGPWLKKSTINSTSNPAPVDKMSYHLIDDHFVVAAIQTSTLSAVDGTIFLAGEVESFNRSELRLGNGLPQIIRTDGTLTHTATSATTLSTDTAHVVSMYARSAVSETLRVDKVQVATFSGSAMSAQNFNQMTIGWNYTGFFSRGSFQGKVYSVCAGKGAPTVSEMAVLEKYLGTFAGLTL